MHAGTQLNFLFFDAPSSECQSQGLILALLMITSISNLPQVWVRASRPPAWRSTLLYNTLGPGEWELISLEATLRTEGGIAKRESLLEDFSGRSNQEQQQGMPTDAGEETPGAR
jgi:hypothetical protein